jgi:hypothetical protein
MKLNWTSGVCGSTKQPKRVENSSYYHQKVS